MDKDSEIKYLKEHIKKMYKIIDGWKELSDKKDEIIKQYEEMLNK